MVHCAAQKYPDKLEADYERSVALNVASTGWLAAATKEVGNSITSNDITEVRTLNQFSRSVGAVCFWTSWFRIRICNLFIRVQIRILPATSKNVIWLLHVFLSLKNGVNVPLKRIKYKNINTEIFVCLLVSWRSVTKRAGSGAGPVSQRYGSEDPIPYQNVTDPEHYQKYKF